MEAGRSKWLNSWICSAFSISHLHPRWFVLHKLMFFFHFLLYNQSRRPLAGPLSTQPVFVRQLGNPVASRIQAFLLSSMCRKVELFIAFANVLCIIVSFSGDISTAYYLFFSARGIKANKLGIKYLG